MDWRSVLDPFTGRYSAGFDPDALCEFMHPTDGKVMTFRLRDAHPLFNVCGLQWREPPRIKE